MARNLMVQLPIGLTRAFSASHRVWYRLSKGRLGGSFRGAPAVLLTTTGRLTHKERTWPLIALRLGDDYALAASNGGHDKNPAWFNNLVANPTVTIQDGGRTITGYARVTNGVERSDLYAQFVELYSGYNDYTQATKREIPVGIVSPA